LRRNCVSLQGKRTVLAEHLLKVPLAEKDGVIDALVLRAAKRSPRALSI
jgi:hypothetical protein